MTSPTLFQRIVLPGFAYKAVVIGGGYATGRELVEFFIPSGPRGGLLAMGVTMLLWSLVCTITFLFARLTHSQDYRTFFQNLLGRGWFIFELSYVCLIIVVLSVFGAAAGEIGAALFGWPPLVSTLILIGSIALTAAYGSRGVEVIFKYVSIFLYLTYALFFILAIATFGGRIGDVLQASDWGQHWFGAGITYASYNLVGAVMILPVTRHLTSTKDAVIAGVLCGPLAIIPAVLFFISMVGFYPQIADEVLPSNFLLVQLGLPAFQVAFQLMIFAALLESGAGAIHAVNERISTTCRERGIVLSKFARLSVSLAMLLLSIFIATKFGLVELIAKGYTGLAYLFLCVYIFPLLTYGSWRLYKAAVARTPAEPTLRFQ